MLEYHISWQFVPVANAVLRIDDQQADLRIRSVGVANWLYPVDVHMTGLLAATGDRSVRYTRRANEGRGGRYQRDIVVTYDWQAGVAVYSNFGNKSEPLALDEAVLDPLSLLTYFRNRDLASGSEVELLWSDGREVKAQNIAVSGREWVETPAGHYPAYKLTPSTRDLGGAFKDTEDPRLAIWISEEKPRIPLKIESRLRVGAFSALLQTPTDHATRREPPETSPETPRRRR